MKQTEKSYRVVVAGFGVAACAHIDALKSIDGFDIVGIYSPAPKEEIHRIKKKLGDTIEIYQDYARMLAQVSPDIVSICTIHDEHANQAILAAKMGAHIILEKPFCTTFKDLERIRNAINQYSVKVCAGFHEFHHGQFRATLDFVEQGFLGDVHLVEVDYYHGIGPWVPQFWWAKSKKHGGSSLLCAGCHALQFLLLCMHKDEVVEVTSYSTSSSADDFSQMEYAGTQVTILKFKSGCIGKVTSCIDSLQPYTFRSTLIGSEGSVIDRKFTSRKISGLDLKQWSHMGARGIDDGDEITAEMYVPMFRSFLADIRGGMPLRFSGFNDAMKMHCVLFAADKSAETGKPIRMETFLTNKLQN